MPSGVIIAPARRRVLLTWPLRKGPQETEWGQPLKGLGRVRSQIQVPGAFREFGEIRVPVEYF